MKVKINSNGYVESPYITDATTEIEITDEQFEKISKFKFYTNWRYIDKDFVLEELLDEDTIRTRRSRECFPYINRGQLWYSHLTSEQTQEFNTWYQAWLNAPETKVIPEKPDWLE